MAAMSVMTRFEDEIAILPPQYLGSVGYYALMGSFRNVTIHIGMRADKRMKSTHRCKIVDTRDELTLTVPVSHPHGPHSWKETYVSTHGEWWNIHLTALESAYGRTPFFEFYIDRFMPLFKASRYENRKENVASIDCEADTVIRSILGFDNNVSVSENCNVDEHITVRDYRNFDFSIIRPVEYYQIRAGKLGFRSGLSIMDLIFNLGPEAPLILKRMMDESDLIS